MINVFSYLVYTKLVHASIWAPSYDLYKWIKEHFLMILKRSFCNPVHARSDDWQTVLVIRDSGKWNHKEQGKGNIM